MTLFASPGEEVISLVDWLRAQPQRTEFIVDVEKLRRDYELRDGKIVRRGVE